MLSLSAVAAVLLVVAWFAAAASATPEALRSRHSEPASAAAPSVVAVTADGKLYHDLACTFIHGPVRIEPGAQAVAEGYTPCTRCLKR